MASQNLTGLGFPNNARLCTKFDKTEEYLNKEYISHICMMVFIYSRGAGALLKQGNKNGEGQLCLNMSYLCYCCKYH